MPYQQTEWLEERWPGILRFAMTANTVVEEIELVQKAVEWLRGALPSTWALEPSTLFAQEAETSRRVDAAYELRVQGGVYTTLVFEAKKAFGPRDVERLMAGVSRPLRRLVPNVAIVVVAPWISARSREMLVDDGLNYIDLTGNAFVKLDNPTLFVKTSGAERDPSPVPRSAAGVKGPRAGRLIRFLADVRPPYGVREIAVGTQLAAGYVSRLLDTLDGEALVERSKRGRVESVNIAGVLRRWAESYDVLKSNSVGKFIAPGGVRSALEGVASDSLPARLAVTGSFAAVRLAPVAAPSLLAMYCDDQEELSAALGLMPADEGADVVLLRPFDPVVWDRAVDVDGVRYVAPSQVAIDCLTGNGRMPSEGEAVLAWMTENEQAWRIESLSALQSKTSA